MKRKVKITLEFEYKEEGVDFESWSPVKRTLAVASDVAKGAWAGVDKITVIDCKESTLDT